MQERNVSKEINDVACRLKGMRQCTDCLLFFGNTTPLCVIKGIGFLCVVCFKAIRNKGIASRNGGSHQWEIMTGETKSLSNIKLPLD